MPQARSERPDLGAVLTHFERQAARYSAASASGLWAWQRHREAAGLEELAGPVEGQAVLDLGCGSGYYAIRLAEAGASPVVAVDASHAMISSIADPRIVTIAGDAATVALERRFHLVVVAGLLEFVPGPIDVLVNARSHLAPRGRVVALAPVDNVAGRLYRKFHRGHGFVINLFDRSGFGLIAERAGLAVVQSKAVFPFGDIHIMVAR